MAVFAIDNGYFPGMREFSTVRFVIQIADSTPSGDKRKIQYSAGPLIKLIRPTSSRTTFWREISPSTKAYGIHMPFHASRFSIEGSI